MFLSQQDVDNPLVLIGSPVSDDDAVQSGAKRLCPRVVFVRIEVAGHPRIIAAKNEVVVAPAREAPGQFGNVLLRIVRVVAFADLLPFLNGKQLQKFPGVVLVGVIADVGLPVQELQHRRVNGHGFQQSAKVSHTVGVEQLEVLMLRPVIDDGAQAEVVDPQQVHLLPQVNRPVNLVVHKPGT